MRAVTSRAPLPLAAAAVVALLAGCAGGPASADGGVAGVSSVTSAGWPAPAAARAVAASLEADHGGAVPDSLIRRRVATLAKQVAAAGDVRLGSIAVLADSDVVARALPGAHLQVSVGLLEVLAPLEPDAGRAALRAVLALLVADAGARRPVARFVRGLEIAGRAGLDPSPLVAADAAAVEAIVAGAPDAAEDAGAFGWGLAALRDPPAEDGPWPEEVSRRALRLVVRAGGRPGELVDAWSWLTAASDAEPERFQPIARALGPLRARLAANLVAIATARAPGGAVVDEPVEVDLTPLRAGVAERVRLDAADLLLVRGQAEAARDLLAEDDGAEVLLVRARAARALGQAVVAERALRAALLLRPDDYATRLELGDLYRTLDRTEAARKELERALTRAPLQAEAHLQLGLVTEDAERLRIARALDQPPGATATAAGAALRRIAPEPSAPRPPDREGDRILGR